MLDIKIVGGTVIDGTGAVSARADVGVLDGRIVAVGEGSDEKSSFTTKKARVVNAVVSNGEAELRRFLDGAP